MKTYMYRYGMGFKTRQHATDSIRLLIQLGTQNNTKKQTCNLSNLTETPKLY